MNQKGPILALTDVPHVWPSENLQFELNFKQIYGSMAYVESLL